jgi:hypothetical protein
MRPRVKLFRGEYAGVWERRLVAAGWPALAAAAWSQFLTGDGPMPHCPAPWRAPVAADLAALRRLEGRSR